MNSPAGTTTMPSHSLPAQLEQIGLRAVPGELDDFLARAAKLRWSPRQVLEHLAQTEAAERPIAAWSGGCGGGDQEVQAHGRLRLVLA